MFEFNKGNFKVYFAILNSKRIIIIGFLIHFQKFVYNFKCTLKLLFQNLSSPIEDNNNNKNNN